MEIYSNTTRFALACNNSSKIIEAIQSRCAILRYGKLGDQEVLRRLVEIADTERVQYADEGLAALIFSAEGDMRQAINNLQSTVAGSGFVSAENVFKVCDQPHPVVVQKLLAFCEKGHLPDALDQLETLWEQGYSALDIVSTLLKVVKGMDRLPEFVKLEFIKVWAFSPCFLHLFNIYHPSHPHSLLPTKKKKKTQEIGFTHMRILEGVSTLVQVESPPSLYVVRQKTDVDVFILERPVRHLVVGRAVVQAMQTQDRSEGVHHLKKKNHY
jgi:replication factor C subunit 2/4